MWYKILDAVKSWKFVATVGILVGMSWTFAVILKNTHEHANWVVHFEYDEEGKVQGIPKLEVELHVHYWQNMLNERPEISLEIEHGDAKVVKTWKMPQSSTE